jgi:hypothetical protein
MDTQFERGSSNRSAAFTLRRSRRGNVRLALLIAATAIVAIPFITAHVAWVQIAGAIWLGICAHAAWRRLDRAAERHPVVMIDANGILDTRVLPRRIDWWEIEFFYPVDPARSRVVELRLRHPHRTLAEAPWHVRLGLEWHREFDLPDVCVSLLLLDATVTDTVEAIRRYAPYLAPRLHGDARRRAPVAVRAPSKL